MKQIITLIFCAICAVSYGQFTPTGTKTNFKNGIALGSKDSTAFNTNDSLAVTIDRNGRFMYRGLGAGAYWKVPQVGTDTVPDTRFVRLQQPTQFRQDGGFWISDTGRTSRLFRAAKFYGDTLQATTSGGARLLSNAGTTVAEFGSGGGGNIDFHDFAGYNANRSSSYTDRSFTDKGYVDSTDALRVRYTDTATMLTPYLRKSDTATMLSVYINKNVLSDMEVPFKTGTSIGGSSSFRWDNSGSGALLLGNSISSTHSLQVGGKVTISDTLLSGTIARIGGTSSQILLADGSVGSTSSYGQGFNLGSIPYSDGVKLTQDNTNLYWDTTYKYLRIGPFASRNDLQLNISNLSSANHAGISINDLTQSYVANAQEAAINMDGKLGNGDIRQRGSLNMYWGNASPTHWYSIIGLHPVGTNGSNNDIKIYGVNDIGSGGISFFNTYDTSFVPGYNVFENWGKTVAHDYSNLDFIRATSNVTTNIVPTGKGLELFYSGTGDQSVIQSYDRDGSVFKPLEIASSTMRLTPGNGYVFQNSDTVATNGFTRSLVNAKLDISNVSGTSGYVPVFNGTNSLANTSTIYHSGGLTSFGATNPQAVLDVTATANAIGLLIRGRSADGIGAIKWYSNDASAEYANLQVNSSGQYLFYNGTSSPTLRATIDNTGLTVVGSIIKSGGTSSQSLMADGSVQTVTSGIFNPTVTAATNATSAAKLSDLFYLRVGDLVYVWGSVGCVPSTANNGTIFYVSLPIASNLSSTQDLQGTGNADDQSGSKNVIVVGDSTNDRALVQFYATSSGVQQGIYFTFSYKVI